MTACFSVHTESVVRYLATLVTDFERPTERLTME